MYTEYLKYYGEITNLLIMYVSSIKKYCVLDEGYEDV